MKRFKSLFLSLTVLTLLASCSSDDPNEDPILGNWAGQITQEDLGLVDITLALITLEVGENGNSLTGEFNDVSNCNNDIFFCDEILGSSCGTSWIYRSRSGNTYIFDEVVNPGDPCADGKIAATVSGDQLRFTFTDNADSENKSSGTLTRQ